MQKNILIIDDEQIVLKTISRFLESRGYGVEVAQSGREALEKVQREKFDLILSDVRMPDMNGIETLKSIREKYQRENNYKVPTVVITGYSSDEAQDQAAELGAVDFLYKPFELDEFYSIIKKNLETKPVYRRAHPRVSIPFPVTLEVKVADDSDTPIKMSGETLNLSEGGLCIVTKKSLPIHSSVKIKIDITSSKSALEADAAIVWIDYKKEKDSFYYGLKFSNIEENYNNLLKETLIKYLFLDERLVALTKDTEFYLHGVMSRFDKFDKMNSSEAARMDFIKKNKKDIFNELDKYFGEAWDIVKDFDRHRYLVHQIYYLQKLKNLFLRGEVNRHVYEKPLGYAGDYIMMNYIFDYEGDKKYLGASSFEKLINHYTCNISICFSNIKRKDFFKNKILELLNKKESSKVLSVGSGSARELVELLIENKISHHLTFQCLDLEKNALDYVKTEIDKIDLKKKSLLNISYIYRDVVAIIRDEELKEILKNCDLIYASGLFDYLKSKMASRLTREFYQLLSEDGEMVICNADLNNCIHRAYYEFLGRWTLVYRTKEEMLEWTKDIQGDFKAKFEDVPDAENYLFLSIKKIKKGKFV